MQKVYYKITNKDENNGGYQYINGLNVLEFDSNEEECIRKNGFYFSTIENIFSFLDYGIYVREITLPVDNKNFKMVEDNSTTPKLRSNMIIFGKRWDLSDVDTFKYLIENGANIHAEDDHALRWSLRHKYLDTATYLINCGANIHLDNEYPLLESVENGYDDIVKLLIKKGANVRADDDWALRYSAEKGDLNMVKLLVENGANIKAQNDAAVVNARSNVYADVVDYLVKKGANIHARKKKFFKMGVLTSLMSGVLFYMLN